MRNSAGTDVVTFKYDAFGNCTVSGDTVLAKWCRIRPVMFVLAYALALLGMPAIWVYALA